MNRLTDAQHAQNALARKRRTLAVLEREIAALEEMVALLARTDDLVPRKEGYDAKQPNGEVRDFGEARD